MSDLAPLLQGFFTDKLMRHLQASAHTIAAYRDTFKLLFASWKNVWAASGPGLAALDSPLIGCFPPALGGHPPQHRHHPQRPPGRPALCYALRGSLPNRRQIQRVLAIPPKRYDRAVVTY